MKNNFNIKNVFFYLGLIVFVTNFFLFNDVNSVSTDSPENFSVIVLPDTQYYSDNYSWIFTNQTRWIIENKESLNIVFVTHLGDLVDDYENIEEWNNANVSMSMLEDTLPFGVLPGNHDGTENRIDLANFNSYFGFNRFANQSWYGGAFQNINSNSYQLFSGGKEAFLIFHIQFDPSDDVLSWASRVIETYPDRRVIISTHDFVHGYNYYSNSRSDIGKRIWGNLVEQHADQIFIVLSGHYENEVRITSLVDGYYIHQLLSDYQDRPNGGNG
ncbi:metallophosphoesterase [Candidatus Bathyarchaeota archaeon]|nr:metallophosphoesterase [Candidatus Bathyarchaeota archaeon]